MRHNSNGISARVLVMAVALTLIIGGIIGGSVAWLTATSQEVVNTFTVGDINIDLSESEDLDLKMVPGNSIKKDPKVTVKAGSEACYLFVKVTESNNLKDFITYSVKTGEGGWTKLDSVDNVYYRVVDAATDDASFDILTNNQVSVLNSVTKEQLEGVKDTNKPTLSFIAYAVQKDNIDTVADAWAKINTTSTPTT